MYELRTFPVTIAYYAVAEKEEENNNNKIGEALLQSSFRSIWALYSCTILWRYGVIEHILWLTNMNQSEIYPLFICVQFDSVCTMYSVRYLHNVCNIQFSINNDGSKRIMFLPLMHSILLTKQIDFTFSFCRSIFLFFFRFQFTCVCIFQIQNKQHLSIIPGTRGVHCHFNKEQKQFFIFALMWAVLGNRMVLISAYCVRVVLMKVLTSDVLCRFN